MAKCSSCGKSLGLFSSDKLCTECDLAAQRKGWAARRLREEEAQKSEEEESRKKEEEQKRREREACEAVIESIRKRLTRNLPVFLYDSVYVPVDSVINNQPINNDYSIDMLKDLGLKGWEVVQIIPRTVGVALRNVGQDPVQKILNERNVSYGGGIGGNVDGVYVLVRKQLHPGWEDDEELGSEVRAFVAKRLGCLAA